MANRSRVITMSPLIIDQEDDLDIWQIVNASDGEFSDDSFSIDSLSDDDVISLDDDASFVVTPLPRTVSVGDLALDLGLDGHADDVVRDEVDENDLEWAQRQKLFLGGDSRGITFGGYENDEGEEDRGGEDVEDDDAYDLDDELVPRSVYKKLRRQRMRKLGKRAIAKVYAAKMSPLKPGCVRGKHGLGMRFNC